jgi:hypothetical protein
MSRVAEMLFISAGVALMGWILSLGWYRFTRRDELDRDTILFFAKLWLGVGALGMLLFFFFKFA